MGPEASLFRHIPLEARLLPGHYSSSVAPTPTPALGAAQDTDSQGKGGGCWPSTEACVRGSGTCKGSLGGARRAVH